MQRLRPTPLGCRRTLHRTLAPLRPLGYAGHHFHVEHVVVAKLDLPWASDVSAEAPFVLRPGLPPDDLTDRSKTLGALKPPETRVEHPQRTVVPPGRVGHRQAVGDRLAAGDVEDDAAG